MPMLAVAVRRLNRRFDRDNIDEFAKRVDDFGPDRQLTADLFLTDESDTFKAAMQAYIDRLPGSFKESLRSTIYYALRRKKPVTFNWIPGYDFELQMWEPSCGVTVLLKGRYPDDPDPYKPGDY